MKRTNINSPDLLKWKNIGGGSFRIGNRIIKRNQVFEAFAHEVPKPFQDTIICLDQEELDELHKKQKLQEDISVESFMINPKGNGWFDVVNVESGKPINQKSLREDAASALLKSLME